MSKFMQALLSGLFFAFFVDFFFFLGIQQNYIDFYKIDLYYNILFADNQNIIIYLILTSLFGYLVIYGKNAKLTIGIIGGVFTLSLLTLIAPIGHAAGEQLFKKENVTLKSKRHEYIGDIYYDGRKTITFYDKEVQKMLIIHKKDLVQ